jgi:PAS domain S-box-containing protein
MGSWEWDAVAKKLTWDQGQYAIFGVDPANFVLTRENVRKLVHPDDVVTQTAALKRIALDEQTMRTEFRIRRPSGETRWCVGVAAASFDGDKMVKLSGVTIDITDAKLAEERQTLLAEEVDHRARNVVAVIQSIMRLTRAPTIESYLEAVDGRIRALSNAHKLLSRSRWEGADLGKLIEEEFAPYRTEDVERAASAGPPICSSRPPRRRWRLRCMSWRPMPRNMARSRLQKAASPWSGISACRGSSSIGASPAVRPSLRRARKATARASCMPASNTSLAVR